MKPLNVPLIGSIAFGALAFGALVSALMVRYGAHPLTITPLIAVLFAIVGVWLLFGGRAVRRLRARQETWVTPVGAARIAVLARATAYVTSGSCGFLAGVALVSFTRMWAPAMAFAAWSALAGALGAAFAAVAAVIVERWCIDSDSTQDGRRGGSKEAPGAA